MNNIKKNKNLDPARPYIFSSSTELMMKKVGGAAHAGRGTHSPPKFARPPYRGANNVAAYATPFYLFINLGPPREGGAK